jgi:hypothetical protein
MEIQQPSYSLDPPPYTPASPFQYSEYAGSVENNAFRRDQKLTRPSEPQNEYYTPHEIDRSYPGGAIEGALFDSVSDTSGPNERIYCLKLFISLTPKPYKCGMRISGH